MNYPQPQKSGGYISNLIQGISQQPSNIRFINQGDECVNMNPNTQSQLGRRNPLEVVNSLTGLTLAGNTFGGWYRRDNNEMYSIILDGTNIKVYSAIDGSVKTVTMSQPGGDTYHQTSNPNKDFYTYTYKDTTFLVNRSVTCLLSSSLSPARTGEGLVKVKDIFFSSSFTTTYTVKLKIGTNAQQTYTVNTSAASTVSTVAQAIGSAMNAYVAGLSGSVTVMENVVWVAHPTLSVSLECSDTRAGTLVQCFTQTIQKSVDLPFYAPDGYIVTVVGSTTTTNAQDSNTVDDTIYKFSTTAGSTFGSGVWKETVAPGIKYTHDPATMPHKLVRQSDGTFVYSQITWNDRLVGDDATNPVPPYIGQQLWSCYLTGNRFGLCILNGSSILSKVDEINYFNFWKTTILTALDTDPVWMPVPSQQANKVYFGQPWNGKLMLLGDNLDASVEWSNVLAPNKITINTPTRFGINPYSPPLICGSSIFFTKNQGDFSLLYEYKLGALTGLPGANNLTEYCASYIPKDIISFTCTNQDSIFMLSDGDRSQLYIYNLNDRDGKVLQQAFHQWTFPTGLSINSIFMDSLSSYLYLLYSYDGVSYIGRINLSQGARDPGYPKSAKSYLDNRIIESYTGVSASYDSVLNQTTVTIPNSYPSSKVIELRAAYTSGLDPYPIGHILPKISETNTTVLLNGKWDTAQFYIGLSVDSYYVPCTFHEYTTNSDRTATVVDLFKKLTIHRLALAYSNTGYYRVEIVNRVTGAVVSSIEMKLHLDNLQTVFDQYKLYGGFEIFSISKSLSTYYIRLRNDSSRASFFTGLAWVGENSDAKQ